jgi:hypothetical protein
MLVSARPLDFGKARWWEGTSGGAGGVTRAVFTDETEARAWLAATPAPA